MPPAAADGLLGRYRHVVVPRSRAAHVRGLATRRAGAGPAGWRGLRRVRGRGPRGRHRRAVLYLRHHRPTQGRHPDAPLPGRQRTAPDRRHRCAAGHGVSELYRTGLGHRADQRHHPGTGLAHGGQFPRRPGAGVGQHPRAGGRGHDVCAAAVGKHGVFGAGAHARRRARAQQHLRLGHAGRACRQRRASGRQARRPARQAAVSAGQCAGTAAAA
ncbi:hypothetical protein D3C78_1160600 [compost metagenome]